MPLTNPGFRREAIFGIVFGVLMFLAIFGYVVSLYIRYIRYCRRIQEEGAAIELEAQLQADQPTADPTQSASTKTNPPGRLRLLVGKAWLAVELWRAYA